MFSCKYCEIFKNTYSEEHLRTAASALIITYNQKVSIGHLAAKRWRGTVSAKKDSISGYRYQDFDGFKQQVLSTT